MRRVQLAPLQSPRLRHRELAALSIYALNNAQSPDFRKFTH